MAETNAPSKPSPKKKRSPVERVIVWGLIGVLLVLALWEGWARFGYSRTLARLQDAIAVAEAAEGDGSLKLAEAEDLVIGFPSRSEGQEQGARNTITYKWNSLFKRNYQIAVTYAGDPPDVLGLETANAPDEEVAEPVVDEEYVETDSAPMGGPPAMHSGGGPPMHSAPQPGGDSPAQDAAVDSAVESTSSDDGPSLGPDPEASDSESPPEPE